jgi:hypothetical protein
MPTIGLLHHRKPGTEAGRGACSDQMPVCLSPLRMLPLQEKSSGMSLFLSQGVLLAIEEPSADGWDSLTVGGRGRAFALPRHIGEGQPGVLMSGSLAG